MTWAFILTFGLSTFSDKLPTQKHFLLARNASVPSEASLEEEEEEDFRVLSTNVTFKKISGWIHLGQE